VVVAQLHADIEIVLVQLDDLSHLIERFLIALEAFESLSQPPMGVGELVVDLQRGTKFKRCFLKLFVFEQSLTARDVLGLGFFGGGARAQQKDGGDYGNEQRKDVELAAALVIFHYCRSPWRFGFLRQLRKSAAVWSLRRCLPRRAKPAEGHRKRSLKV